MPFALDTLPEAFEKEPNNDPRHAQKVTLPVIINGRIDRPDDWDVFQFTGKSNERSSPKSTARRLDSPLDSVIKLTDAKGKLLAFNDDHEDLGSGLNTHHADSYLMARLPADGIYYVHIGDTARKGGEEYAYRLRLSAPQPDFALRVVPSSSASAARTTAPLSIYVIRKDGFTGPIKLVERSRRRDSPLPRHPSATQAVGELTVKTTLNQTPEPVTLGSGRRSRLDRELARQAVPGRRPHAGFPVAASGARPGAEGPGLRPILQTT